MSKLTRKGAAADASRSSSGSRTTEGGRTLDSLFASFKSNLTKKATNAHRPSWEEEEEEDGDDDDFENNEENGVVDPLDAGDGLRRVDFPSAKKSSYPKFENVEKEYESMYEALEKSRDDKKKEKEGMKEKMRRMASAVEKEKRDEESAKASVHVNPSLHWHNRMFRITLYSSFQNMVTMAVVLYALLETADNWEGNSSIEKKGGTSWEVIQALHYIVSLIFFLKPG